DFREKAMDEVSQTSHFVVPVPAFYRYSVVFVQQSTRWSSGRHTSGSSALRAGHWVQTIYVTYAVPPIPSGFATSSKSSAALTNCSFLCPALTIARKRALPSATVG